MTILSGVVTHFFGRNRRLGVNRECAKIMPVFLVEYRMGKDLVRRFGSRLKEMGG